MNAPLEIRGIPVTALAIGYCQSFLIGNSAADFARHECQRLLADMAGLPASIEPTRLLVSATMLTAQAELARDPYRAARWASVANAILYLVQKEGRER